ncbi:MAG: hypothetical protein WBL40_02860 [Terrimicrobiaceae bacterium]
MPAFKYTPDSYETAPIGVHLAQVVKAEQTRAKSSGNEMLRLTLHTIPDGYFLNYFLVFNGKSDGLITQFCRHCEGELSPPEDPSVPFSLITADVLRRLVFVDVEHDTSYSGEPQAKVRLGGILSRAKALALNPNLASIKLPTNVPAPQTLAEMPAAPAKAERPSEAPRSASPSTGALPAINDDLLFAPNISNP